MRIIVSYTVTYESVHDVPDDRPIVVSDLPIEIPQCEGETLDPDSFHVLGVYDEDGNEVSYRR